jgi:hypothetical protein
MTADSSKYDGPALCVSLTAATADGATKYEWHVTLSASDYKGHRKLGYRASGLLNSLHILPPYFPIQVHDADRNVWTTMNPEDRADIRKRIESLVVHALKTLSAGGY